LEVVEALDVSQRKERNENQKGDGGIVARIERCRDIDFFNRIVLAENAISELQAWRRGSEPTPDRESIEHLGQSRE
jgi:hypothetical protein